ncbi:MAG: hypothetical protein JEY99_19420 [Spirochaetales bacterium]|nr:hypothetical protein [Spirochaetales bacterium]
MKKILISILITLICAGLFAQEPVLSDGDVERFILTFPEITEELGALGQSLENANGRLFLPWTVRTSEEVKRTFLDRGWDEGYFERVQLILLGFSLILAESEMLTVMPDVQEALDEIDSTPVSSYFTAEMKKQTRDMMVAAVRGMNQALYDELDSIAPSDMEKIRAHKDELTAFLKEL